MHILSLSRPRHYFLLESLTGGRYIYIYIYPLWRSEKLERWVRLGKNKAGSLRGKDSQLANNNPLLAMATTTQYLKRTPEQTWRQTARSKAVVVWRPKLLHWSKRYVLLGSTMPTLWIIYQGVPAIDTPAPGWHWCLTTYLCSLISVSFQTWLGSVMLTEFIKLGVFVYLSTALILYTAIILTLFKDPFY
jgi:hypothetical protein